MHRRRAKAGYPGMIGHGDTSTQTEVVDLGPADFVGPLPRRVDIHGRAYFLVGEPGRQLRLLSSTCPHKGGVVADAGGVFECPRHGWRFDYLSGRCLNAPSASLTAFPVYVHEGRLVAELAHVASAPPPHRPALAKPLTIKLHAHACLELTYGDFSLLTDPWLDGPAFFGSWTQYPAPRVGAADLDPDAIWISHEHSDHFHERTLAGLARSTPVLVPDFPNQRLPRRLEELGFVDVRAMPFGDTFELADGVSITCFEPATLWNDSIILVEFGDFRYLNLNDAGINHRIADLVAPVDLISSTFSPGASGYPLTWTHLSDERKADIMERSRQGSLDMLRDAVRAYGASYVLPFASFFTLRRPEHGSYLKSLRKNSPAHVVTALTEEGVKVVDLLPGECWDVGSGDRTTVFEGERDRIFESVEMLAFAQAHWAETELEAAEKRSVTLDEVRRYFLRLNETAEIAFCEDLTVSLRGITDDDEPALRVDFEVATGRLELCDARGESNVTIELPLHILAHIVQDDLSWDEAFIGYWCRLSRSPDVYHAGFWRVLQAPYYGRSHVAPGECNETVHADSTIGEVLEAFGQPADRVLRRFGLYCVGCQRSPMESLRQGALKHGLGEHELERLVAELHESIPSVAVATEEAVG